MQPYVLALLTGFIMIMVIFSYVLTNFIVQCMQSIFDKIEGAPSYETSGALNKSRSIITPKSSQNIFREEMHMFCKKCGKQLSDDAVFCDKCGARMKGEDDVDVDESPRKRTRKKTPKDVVVIQRKSGCFTKIFAGVGALVVIIVVISIMSNNGQDGISPQTTAANQSTSGATQKPTSTDRPTATPTPIAISAEDLYGAYDENEIAADKKYKGQILTVRGKINNIDQDYGGGYYVTLDTGEWNLFSIQCYFGKDQEDNILNLKKGSTINITGRCDGWNGNIDLKDCSF